MTDMAKNVEEPFDEGKERIERHARQMNSADLWDKLWVAEGDESWRKEALNRVYRHIERELPESCGVVDLGGGVGILADQLKEAKQACVCVCDISEEALALAGAKGHKIYHTDLEDDLQWRNVFRGHEISHEGKNNFLVATEVLEHLSETTRGQILNIASAQKYAGCFFSVPNNRLGPEEEPQHTIKFTAIQFKHYLGQFFEDVFVEALGPFLLGVCGPIAHKPYRLSVTMPVRDEARDIEKVLASFRGVADEMVIGIDPRTKDNTFEIAERYADKVFLIDSPAGVGEEFQGEGKAHFSHCRNQCLDQCTGDWIFMTEGHERLIQGDMVLRHLDKVMPKQARVGFVFRNGGGQRWAFPWLFQRAPDIKFSRAVHNALSYPDGTYCVRLPQIHTYHERSQDNAHARAQQRNAQNRNTLLDDWRMNQNENSLFYLAQEWRQFNTDKALTRYEEFLARSHNGPQRYQVQLVIAKESMGRYLLSKDKGEKRQCIERARRALFAATADDWSRTEHWLWLGDLANIDEAYEQAYKFYRYAATGINEAPFTVWWIDEAAYSYLPAQRLAMVCAELGNGEEALRWARSALELLPDDAPYEVVKESRQIIKELERLTVNRLPQDKESNKNGTV
jgi:2-polyprenyl-3-methyl-5-hydroxy-6-metoxy-1,4-benzoquinol methylase/tetratricopeptide (TPR) repeat protein